MWTLSNLRKVNEAWRKSRNVVHGSSQVKTFTVTIHGSVYPEQLADQIQQKLGYKVVEITQTETLLVP